MNHKDRMDSLYRVCKAIMELRQRHNPEALPDNVDRAKLEAAYDALKEYEFILKRKVAH